MPKTTHIEYGESVQTGYDTWRRLSVRIEIEEGDDISSEQEKLISHVSERMAKFAEIDKQSKYGFVKTKADNITPTIEAINACKTEKELKDFWMLSKSNLTLVEAYNKKLNQFTNA